MRFRQTVACTRAAVPATYDDFGNLLESARAAVSFAAAFSPPTTEAGSRIVDGALQQTAVTKPTLFIDRRTGNAAALAQGALQSGDYLTVGGQDGWQIDGDPAQFTNPFTGKVMPLVVELRRTV